MPNQTIIQSNMLIIAGDGRNVGKTFIACKSIEHLAKNHKVVAVKITPHFHDYNPENALIVKEDFVILQEDDITNKDSSLMLQAGAEKVFFVMCKRDKLREAFSYLSLEIMDHPVVIESGGLHQIIRPQLFWFVKNQGQEIEKTPYLDYKPTIIENDHESIPSIIEDLDFMDNTLYLKSKS